MDHNGFKLPDGCCNSCPQCEDKENVRRLGSPLKNESDLSLYGNSSPRRTPCGRSPARCSYQAAVRRALEDHDPNSQDSGYGTSCPGEGGRFYSYRPISSQQRNSPGKTVSFESIDSMDDEFLELSDLEPIDENARLPSDFNKLITGPIISIHKRKSPLADDGIVRPIHRRSMSLDESHTPNSSRVRSCLFKPTGDVELLCNPNATRLSTMRSKLRLFRVAPGLFCNGQCLLGRNQLKQRYIAHRLSQISLGISVRSSACL
jgi:hypothetical protein